MGKETVAGTDITKAELLEKLNAKADYFSAEIEPDIQERLMTVMDQMRFVLDLRQDEFAPLLGITRNAYCLAVRKKRVLYNVIAFIRFCYIFGYDFEQMLFSDIASRRDAAIYELAIRLGNLPDDLIKDFCESVRADSRIDGHKAHALMVAFSNYQNLRAETIKACVSTPEDEPDAEKDSSLEQVDESPV